MKKSSGNGRSPQKSRTYPSILEIALKAGKWSVIAGGSAIVMAASGCEEEASTPGVLAIDSCVADDVTDSGQWAGMPPVDVNLPDDTQYVPDSASEGVTIPDEGMNTDQVTNGLPPEDAWWPTDDGGPRTDAVEIDANTPLPGEPPIEDVYDPGDAVNQDPGLTGDPIPDVITGDVLVVSDTSEADADANLEDILLMGLF